MLIGISEVFFLGFVVSSMGVKVDESKIDAIKYWPTPTSNFGTHSFHGLTSFYRQFVKLFSTVDTLFTKII